MATQGTEKYIQKRWCILIMRPQSKTHTLTISPFFILLMATFVVLFTVGGVMGINRYLELYPNHLELQNKYAKSVVNLNNIKNMYEYQTEVNDDYFKLLNTSSKQADPTTTGELTSLSSKDEKAISPPKKTKNSLLDWSNLFPNPINPTLDVVEFKVVGENFNFRLANNNPERTPALGNLLLLFKVKTGGETTLIPFPKFDFQTAQPDFTTGPGYNIQYSKVIQGLLEMPPHSQILELMVVGKSQGGRVVLKKRLSPLE